MSLKPSIAVRYQGHLSMSERVVYLWRAVGDVLARSILAGNTLKDKRLREGTSHVFFALFFHLEKQNFTLFTVGS